MSAAPPVDHEGRSPAGAIDVLHVDMDCFFAAVEVADDPTLRDRPVIVGGSVARGVVAAASYEARAYGVHSAMPVAVAVRRCPDAVLVAPRHARYAELNAAFRRLVADLTPAYEPIGLDEAYLDVRSAHRLFGSSTEIAASLRDAVAATLGLSCSIGVAGTKLVAKLASRAAKPTVALDGVPPRPVVSAGAGITVVHPADAVAFVRSHPLGALPGVGPKTRARLDALGIHTVAEAAVIGRARLERLIGAHQGALVADFAHAVDDRAVAADRTARSIGRERTFERDLYDEAAVATELRGFAAALAARLRARKLAARTVTLKVRYRDHEDVLRSMTGTPVAAADELVAPALLLAADVAYERGIRLAGIHVSNFVDAALATEQLSLFERARPRALDDVLDRTDGAVRRGFGGRGRR